MVIKIASSVVCLIHGDVNGIEWVFLRDMMMNSRCMLRIHSL